MSAARRSPPPPAPAPSAPDPALSPSRLSPGELVRQARLAKGLGARKLARLARLDEASVRQIERGRRPLGADVAGRLARALEIRADALLEALRTEHVEPPSPAPLPEWAPTERVRVGPAVLRWARSRAEAEGVPLQTWIERRLVRGGADATDDVVDVADRMAMARAEKARERKIDMTVEDVAGAGHMAVVPLTDEQLEMAKAWDSGPKAKEPKAKEPKGAKASSKPKAKASNVRKKAKARGR